MYGILAVWILIHVPLLIAQFHQGMPLTRRWTWDQSAKRTDNPLKFYANIAAQLSLFLITALILFFFSNRD